tara:strand:- start:893 stop:2863 length:1971 start_codon:yes stop_codon:yes gene_type:complete
MMPQQFDLLKASAITEIQEDLESVVSLYRDQAELAAIAAGAPLVTSLTDPVPANGSIELLQTGAGTQIHEVKIGAWVQIGWLGVPLFPTIAAMSQASGFVNGQTVDVEKGFNGKEEHFFAKLEGDAAALDANGTTIIDAEGMGVDPATRGRLISRRTEYASLVELGNDTRSFGDGVSVEAEGQRYETDASAPEGSFVPNSAVPPVKFRVLPTQTGALAYSAFAKPSTQTLDNTASLNYALEISQNEVVVPSGVWRVDGPIDVLDGKKLHLNQGANLKRFAEHSDSTDPVLRVLGVGSEAHGGQVETENAHPDGVLAAGHKDLVELRNAWWWKVTSMTLLGVKAAGNRGIKVVNADNSDAPIFANYFGSMSNIQVRGSDVGLELLEVANAHQFFDIQFWDLMTAAYRLRGAFENMFVGGFVHACDPGITCIQLLNRTTGPHDTVGNQFLGIGMEPATGTANEFICSIESNCSQNTIQAFGNCAGGFGTIANTNNYINASYGEFYTDASRAIITGSHRIDGAGYQRRGPNISKSKKGQLAENATTEVLEIEVGFGTSCVIASVDITMANSALGHTAVVSKKYALRRDADGVIQVSELSGDRAGTQAAYDFDWRINDDYRAFGRISTFNNGTGTLTDYSLEVTLTTLDENVPVDKLKII